MMPETPLKCWLIESAQRFAVCPATIWKWRRRGLFTGIIERRVNARVILISGAARLLRRHAGRRYDFARVDWSQRNRDIARALGCHPSLVSYYRKRQP